MKFGERLTELRKKEGLSQEELGYKLNVTRQTVSKWELGQTTPEMDKLVELGKIFNISVDELVAETETTTNETTEKEVIQDAPVKEKSSNSNTKAIILVIAIVVIFVAIMIYIFTAPFRMIGKVSEGMFDRIFGIFNEVQDNINDGFVNETFDYENGFEEQKELAENIISEIKEKIDDKDEQLDSTKEEKNKNFIGTDMDILF